ncbi:arylamine N-acetyltransferase [Klebsiella sp. BIGb0407]|uniref:arylamine N-acetyltransferase family protein n=1 Tax=Klebsiella sp. BIGb0407 TaxID=2940603 RepID=UPI002167096F|nr:arylamine N-acetyltransferase [Klebsiella sp. BIGb0407]MCS3429794.1 N-hydroxyarylamine O-acetyltransferase [Klebsiella sp. BIGb0407]
MSFCLESYFKRINYQGSRSATLETLKQLHHAHTYAIAFENLDVLLGRTIKTDDDSVFDKLVSAGRGGWCFEQNGLFRRVLKELGFVVTNLSGRVLLANPAQLPGRTHRITLVTFGDEAWLADVGFGGKTLPSPIRLRDGEVLDTAYGRYSLEQEEGTWLLKYQDGEKTLKMYCFTLEPQFDSDYEMGNHYVSTWPASHFRHCLTLSLYHPEGGRSTLYSAAEKMPVFSHPEELYQHLQQVFNLRFDDNEHGISLDELTVMLERLKLSGEH